jgi:hypothetical protein
MVNFCCVTDKTYRPCSVARYMQKLAFSGVNSPFFLLFWPVGQKQTVMRVYIGGVGRIVVDESHKINSVDEPNSGYVVHPNRKG